MSRRKFEALNVVKMYATLTADVWKRKLIKHEKAGDINGLMALRYSLQAGLADAVKNGFKDANFEMWVIKRTRDCERVARRVFNKKFNHPVQRPGQDKLDYMLQAIALKRKRDAEFARFVKESSY